MLVNVQRGTARPYYLRSKGIPPEGVYIRHGAAKVPASESSILKMIQATSGDSDETARSIMRQLILDNTKALFKRRDM